MTFSAASLRSSALTLSVIQDNNKRSTKPFCCSYVSSTVKDLPLVKELQPPLCKSHWVVVEHMRDKVMQTMPDVGARHESHTESCLVT